MSQSSDSSLSKTWGNGRVVTGEQVRRKKIGDRESKRKQREEARELKTQNIVLTKRVSELETENIKLKTGASNNKPFVEEGNPSSFQSLAEEDDFVNFARDDLCFHNRDFSIIGNRQDCTSVQSCDVTALEDATVMEADGLETTQTFNGMIALAEASVNGQHVVQDNDISDDFLIKAVTIGWDFAFRTYRLNQCYLWGLLEKVDQTLYKDCPELSRMAHLRKIHRMFMFILFGKQLPNWYNATEIQHEYRHDSIINFIAQPRLRDRLILSKVHNRPPILTNKFWEIYTRCVQFNYSLCGLSAFDSRETQGFWRFSESFNRTFDNEASWILSAEIFAEFPDLADDGTLEKWRRWPLTAGNCPDRGPLLVDDIPRVQEQQNGQSEEMEDNGEEGNGM